LPPLCRLPRSWSLLYSLDQHGISIHTFYREIAKSFEAPNPSTGGCVLAVRDARGGVFGVWIGEKIRMGGGSYYGSGESFLWKLDKGAKEGDEPTIKVFKWTGKNEYVALCEDDYISFGGGDGRTGLYLDSAFDRGYSERCPCFDNEPLCFSADGLKGRFSCVALEVWRVGL
ncbi:TLD-domain-containing protein, partial [Calocera cornea HHB12733]